MARLRGRAPRGERCCASVPHGHWKTTTFTGALRLSGLTAPMVLDGAMNGTAFDKMARIIRGPSRIGASLHAMIVPMKLMRAEDIPAFIQDVIATGCDVCAIGHTMYVIGDTDLPEAEYKVAEPKLRRICQAYGERDHLLPQIVAYLRSIGRYVDFDERAMH